eukprot:403372333
MFGGNKQAPTIGGNSNEDLLEDLSPTTFEDQVIIESYSQMRQMLEQQEKHIKSLQNELAEVRFKKSQLQQLCTQTQTDSTIKENDPDSQQFNDKSPDSQIEEIQQPSQKDYDPENESVSKSDSSSIDGGVYEQIAELQLELDQINYQVQLNETNEQRLVKHIEILKQTIEQLENLIEIERQEYKQYYEQVESKLLQKDKQIEELTLAFQQQHPSQDYIYARDLGYSYDGWDKEKDIYLKQLKEQQTELQENEEKIYQDIEEQELENDHEMIDIDEELRRDQLSELELDLEQTKEKNAELLVENRQLKSLIEDLRTQLEFKDQIHNIKQQQIQQHNWWQEQEYQIRVIDELGDSINKFKEDSSISTLLTFPEYSYNCYNKYQIVKYEGKSVDMKESQKNYDILFGLAQLEEHLRGSDIEYENQRILEYIEKIQKEFYNMKLEQYEDRLDQEEEGDDENPDFEHDSSEDEEEISKKNNVDYSDDEDEEDESDSDEYQDEEDDSSEEEQDYEDVGENDNEEDSDEGFKSVTDNDICDYDSIKECKKYREDSQIEYDYQHNQIDEEEGDEEEVEDDYINTYVQQEQQHFDYLFQQQNHLRQRMEQHMRPIAQEILSDDEDESNLQEVNPEEERQIINDNVKKLPKSIEELLNQYQEERKLEKERNRPENLHIIVGKLDESQQDITFPLYTRQNQYVFDQEQKNNTLNQSDLNEEEEREKMLNEASQAIVDEIISKIEQEIREQFNFKRSFEQKFEEEEVKESIDRDVDEYIQGQIEFQERRQSIKKVAQIEVLSDGNEEDEDYEEDSDDDEVINDLIEDQMLREQKMHL